MSYNVPLGRTSYSSAWGLCFYIYIYIYQILISVWPYVYAWIELKTITIQLKLYIFLEDVQIIHSISWHFFKPCISEICNCFSLYIYIYIYDLEYNWF